MDGIGRATSKAVTGITVAAQYVGDTIAKGAERYKSKREACKDPKPVSETTKKRYITHARKRSLQLKLRP